MSHEFGPRVPMPVPLTIDQCNKESTWLHEYATLGRHQKELEGALTATLTTPLPSAVTSASLHSRGDDDNQLHGLTHTQVNLLTSENVARSAQGEAQERLQDHVRSARAALRNGLLGLVDNPWNRDDGSASFDPASPATLLAGLPTTKARARANCKKLLTTLREDIQVEGDRLAEDAVALDSVSEDARALLLRYNQAGKCLPLQVTTTSPGFSDDLPEGHALCKRTAYTGTCYSEDLEAAEESYTAFLSTHGGLTLGWPEDLHDAFLRVVQQVQGPGGARCLMNESEYGTLFLSGPSPAPPLPLLEAAKAWFYTIMPVPEIERHVELYVRQQAMLQVWQEKLDRYRLSKAQHKSSSLSRALVPVSDDPLRQTRIAAVVCESPWQRSSGKELPLGHYPAGCYEDAALQAAIVANMEEAERREQQRAAKKRQLETWRAKKTAEEERVMAQKRAEAATERRRKRETFKEFQEEQRRKNRLGLQPTGQRDQRQHEDKRADDDDEAAKASRAALNQQRRENRRLRQAALLERQQRDLQEAKSRKERIDALKTYETQHSKAAVSARYLRVVATQRHTGADGNMTVHPGVGGSTASAGAVGARPPEAQRYQEVTATRTQHILPDWQEERFSEEMGQRGRWLSPAMQQCFSDTSTGLYSCGAQRPS